MNKLSHSSASRFQDCPKSWEYHYVQKIRPSTSSSALLFGSAIDAAVTQLVKPSDKTAEEVFNEYWQFQEVNNVETYLPTATNIVYANSDYDKELLLEEDINKLEEKFKVDNALDAIDEIYRIKDRVSFDGLNDFQKLYLIWPIGIACIARAI